MAGEPVTPVETKLDYGVFDYKTFAAESVTHNTIMEEVYFDNRTGEDQSLVFNHFYYPGWSAYLLDKESEEPVSPLPIVPEEDGTLGRMTVPAPPGEGAILLRFEDTPPRTIGRIISLLTLCVLLIFGLWSVIRRRRVPNRP